MKPQTENKMENLKTAIYKMNDFYSKKNLIKIKISECEKFIYLNGGSFHTSIKITENLEISETEDVYRIDTKNIFITIWKKGKYIHTTILI